jgi:hypothetical protein
LTKIQSAANSVNGSLLLNLYEYMKNNGSSDSRINNTLKTNSLFAHFLGPEVSFYDVTKKNQITLFLDTKMKSAEEGTEGSSFSSFRLFVPKIQQIIA